MSHPSPPQVLTSLRKYKVGKGKFVLCAVVTNVLEMEAGVCRAEASSPTGAAGTAVHGSPRAANSGSVMA